MAGFLRERVLKSRARAVSVQNDKSLTNQALTKNGWSALWNWSGKSGSR
jgi:hypothetical protein